MACSLKSPVCVMSSLSGESLPNTRFYTSLQTSAPVSFCTTPCPAGGLCCAPRPCAPGAPAGPYFLTPRACPSSLFLTLSTVQALAGPGPPAVSCPLLVPSCPSSWHSMHLTRGHVQLGPADWADGSMNCASRLLFSGHESLRTREAGSKKLMSWMKKERTSFTSVFIAVVG